MVFEIHHDDLEQRLVAPVLNSKIWNSLRLLEFGGSRVSIGGVRILKVLGIWNLE